MFKPTKEQMEEQARIAQLAMGEPEKLRRFTVAELAEQEFHARERLRAMDMMNVPTDYEERKKAAIARAEAQAEAVRARLALESAINNPVQ